MFSCFYPITGGRVGEIVSQQSNSCCSKNKEDKFKKFCETYKDYVDVSGAYEKFAGQWEQQKKAGTSPSLVRALAKSFYADLLKAFFSKLVWSVLVIFSIWFFVFEILAFIKGRTDVVDQAETNCTRPSSIVSTMFSCFYPITGGRVGEIVKEHPLRGISNFIK